jgi:chromosomal replication initiation ATPase DnaA
MAKQEDLFPSATVRQAVLDLPPAAPSFTRAAFVVAASNEQSLATADAWVKSAERAIVVSGPAGAGKTHLVRIIATAIDDLVVIDDAGEKAPPEAILAALESATHGGGRVAIAGRGEPLSWARGLRDLETRLNAAPRISLSEPDESLLVAVIEKLFRDRQLRGAKEIAEYASPRLAKTFEAAGRFVAAMDAASIECGRPIGVKLAKEILANLSEAASGAY